MCRVELTVATSSMGARPKSRDEGSSTMEEASQQGAEGRAGGGAQGRARGRAGGGTACRCLAEIRPLRPPDPKGPLGGPNLPGTGAAMPSLASNTQGAEASNGAASSAVLPAGGVSALAGAAPDFLPHRGAGIDEVSVSDLAWVAAAARHCHQQDRRPILPHRHHDPLPPQAAPSCHIANATHHPRSPKLPHSLPCPRNFLLRLLQQPLIPLV